MKKIVGHWDVGRGDMNASAAAHYHFFSDSDGVVHACNHTPEDNLNCRDGVYAAHTRHCNTGAIGVCAGGMYGAKGPNDLGRYPVTLAAWNGMCRKTAECCILYGIEPTPRTVLTHAEVQETLGIKQNGKWDYTILPFDPSVRGAKACGDRFRADVKRFMAEMSGIVPAEAPKRPEERSRNRYLQKLLVRAGYPVGDLDGWVGAKTKSAVQDFCRDHGLEYEPVNPFSVPVVSKLREQEAVVASQAPKAAKDLATRIAAEDRISTTEIAQAASMISGSGLPIASFVRESLPPSVFAALLILCLIGLAGGAFWTIRERRRYRKDARKALYNIEDVEQEQWA